MLSFKGKAVLKHLIIEPHAVSFKINALRPTALKAFLKGKSFIIMMDGKRLKSSSPEVSVPAGRHRVEIKRLD